MKDKLKEIQDVKEIKEQFIKGGYKINDRKKSKSNTLSALKYHLKRNGYSGDVLFFVFNPPPTCKICKKELELTDITHGRQYVYPKCCRQCISTNEYHKIPCSEEKRKKISLSNKSWAETSDGIKSHKQLGKNNSKKLKEFYQTSKGKERIEDIRKHNSKCMAEAIKNGTFTPNITNTWTHWDAIVILNDKEYKFRSSWEACFYICNSSLEYETFRVPYILDGISKTYIADFYDNKQKIIYEIKPTTSYNTQYKKIEKIKEYCKVNMIKFIWINEENILQYIDETKIIGNNRKQYDKMIKGIIK